MMEQPTWRQLLGAIVSRPGEKRRIAEAIQIRERTLDRWIRGEANPPPKNIARLLGAVPVTDRKNLMDVMKSDFPEVIRSIAADDLATIPADIAPEFLWHILDVHRETALSLEPQVIVQETFLRMLGHLDLNRLGLALLVAACVSEGDEITHLQIDSSLSKGSGIWHQSCSVLPATFGSESIIGQAAQMCKEYVLDVHRLAQEEDLGWLSASDHLKSMAAFPLLRSGQIAGSLVVLSTQPDFFHCGNRCELLRRYAMFVALAYRDHQFHDRHHLALRRKTPQSSAETNLDIAIHKLRYIAYTQGKPWHEVLQRLQEDEYIY